MIEKLRPYAWIPLGILVALVIVAVVAPPEGGRQWLNALLLFSACSVGGVLATWRQQRRRQ